MQGTDRAPCQAALTCDTRGTLNTWDYYRERQPNSTSNDYEVLKAVMNVVGPCISIPWTKNYLTEPQRKLGLTPEISSCPREPTLKMQLRQG